MNKKATNPFSGEKPAITKQELKERIEEKLVTRGVFNPDNMGMFGQSAKRFRQTTRPRSAGHVV